MVCMAFPYTTGRFVAEEHIDSIPLMVLLRWSLLRWSLSSCLLYLYRYRALGVESSNPEDVVIKRVQKLQKRFDRMHLKNALKSNVIRNLPQNVPY